MGQTDPLVVICPPQLFFLVGGCAGSPSLCVGFPCCGKQELLSSWGGQASHYSGFSRGAWALGTWASALEAHGLSSCSCQALEC